MIDEEYVATMQRLQLLANVVADNADEIQQCLATISRVHSVGPILDPTAYRNGMRNLDDQSAMLRPLAAAAAALVPLFAKFRERQATSTDRAAVTP